MTLVTGQWIEFCGAPGQVKGVSDSGTEISYTAQVPGDPLRGTGIVTQTVRSDENISPLFGKEADAAQAAFNAAEKEVAEKKADATPLVIRGI